jgi:ribosomal protein S27E
MSGLEWTPDVSIYRQPWRESTGACLQAPAGEGITMSNGRFWMIKCPSCKKAVFRFQDEPPEQATCNCGFIIPGPEQEAAR